LAVEIFYYLPAGGGGTFPGIIFENPPFILEKRQILLQGSLSV
jgi:hypothetical protein